MARGVAVPDIGIGQIANFAGGPNFRDTTDELAANESYGSYNCTFDERGAVASRLGYVKRNVTPLAAAKVVNDFYSSLLGVQLTQAGADLFRGDSNVSVHTFSTTGCVTFAEFNTVVVAVHPIDGIWTSPDGTVWTKVVAANAPTTNTLCVATWQARLFVGLSDGTLHWCDEGTLATWTATNFVAVWEKDQAPIVALHVGSGQDIQGNPGLLAFKQDSVYRVNDPLTGAFTALSTTVGCGGPKAVVGVGARVCWVGKHGIYWWAEGKGGPVNASDLLRPLWRSEQLSFTNQSGWAAGRRLNRALFSVSTFSSSVNDLALEFHPDEGWIAPRSDAMACYSMSTGSNELTFGGSPTVNGQLYKLESGATDDGAAITGFFQTRWIAPHAGFKVSLWQIRLRGRGVGTMTVRADYEDSGGNQRPFSLVLSGPKWGTFKWGDGTRWASTALQATQAFYNVATCHQFSLRFDFSVSTTVNGRTLFGNAIPPVLGSFGLYQAEYLFVPLGLS